MTAAQPPQGKAMSKFTLWQQSLIFFCLVFTLTATAQTPAVTAAVSAAATTAVEQSAADTTDADTPVSSVSDTNVDPAMAVTTNVPEEAPVLPHDLSAWGMFQQADWIVKTVMIGLALSSLMTWTVLVAKTRELKIRVRQQKYTLDIVAAAPSLKAAHQLLSDGQGTIELANAAADELRLSANVLADAEGVKERVASSLERLEAACGRRITRGTSILATIGATAPFVGLFGTVWGIMNSFIGISKAQTTNLAVVAPGIAEALLATALGLVAAIPAVVIYNHFARQIATYKALVGDTSAALLRLVSRDLSRFSVSGHKPADKE
jgi:biopolymer transport protein ExbB